MTAETKTESPALHKIKVESTGYYCFDKSEQSEKPVPAFIGLHGYGQTAPDFLQVTRKVAPAEFTAVAAQGFHQVWDRATRAVTFSWMTAFEKADNIQRNNDFLRLMLDQLIHEQAISNAPACLLGFSQGSSVAYRFAQRHPDRVRGIIAVCADLPPDVERDLTPLKSIPVLVCYGQHDKIVSPQKSIDAFDALREGGIDVELISFERGHVVSSLLAPKLSDWMARKSRK